MYVSLSSQVPLPCARELRGLATRLRPQTWTGCPNAASVLFPDQPKLEPRGAHTQASLFPRGQSAVLLTTIGLKTGQPRTTPLLYLDDGDEWVVAASDAGADWEPGWWLNLRAGSAATVQIAGRRTPVTGTEITGAERDRMWQLLNEHVFDYDSYQQKVSRQIAVVALTPAPA